MAKKKINGVFIHQFQEILLGQIFEGEDRGKWTFPEVDLEEDLVDVPEKIEAYLKRRYDFDLSVNPVFYNEIETQSVRKRNYLAKMNHEGQRVFIQKTDKYKKMRFVPVDVLMDMQWAEIDKETVQKLITEGLGE